MSSAGNRQNAGLRRRRLYPRGFTLVELLVVLTLLALFAVLAVPSLSSTAGIEQRATAQQVAATLREARTLAVRSGLRQAVHVEVDERSVHYAGRTLTLSGDVDIAIKTAARAITPSGATFWFYPDGSATGGSMQLTGPASSQRIEVQWLTGTVRVAAPTP